MAGLSSVQLSVLFDRCQHFVAVAVVSFLLCPITAVSASADPIEPPQPKYGWREVWGGGDAMRDVWLLYSGVTIAPWSEHIYAPGWRLRSQAGYGQYRYNYFAGPEAPAQKFKAEVTYTDALIGYHMRLGELTAKIFAGITAIDHNAPPAYANLQLFGTEYGPKGMVELWLNVGQTNWTSLNLAFTTAHKTTSARWRWGFKPMPELSIGPELRFDTNAQRYQKYGEILDGYLGRAGLFASYKWPSMELSVAGGLAATINGVDTDRITPYGTVNVLFQY